MAVRTFSSAGISGGAAGLQFVTSADCGTSAAVSINNCFTSTYDVYRVVLTGVFKSGAVDNLLARLRLSGTDATTNYAYQYILGDGTNITAYRGTAATSARQSGLAGDGNNAAVIDIFNPALATTTQFISASLYAPSNIPQILYYVSNHTTATAYDGITFFPESNAFGGGTIRVYGYRNS